MSSLPPPTGPPSTPLFGLLEAAGTHAHCRGCKERVNVSAPVALAGWHTVHACAPEHAIEVNVRAAGAAPWAWRYAADISPPAAPLAPRPGSWKDRSPLG